MSELAATRAPAHDHHVALVAVAAVLLAVLLRRADVVAVGEGEAAIGTAAS